MCAAATEAARRLIRYNDYGSQLWLWTEAPCSWRGKVQLHFAHVPLRQLRPEAGRIDPSVIASYLSQMQQGRALAPPVVCASESGALYIRDGKHRYEAMQLFFSGDKDAWVRVAIAVPKSGYHFRYRRFGRNGAYVLEPVAPLVPPPAPFSRRTVVLVAHPDDETGCAGLLQRLADPMVIFATDGAPTDEYFWGPYGSRLNYSRVRRREAIAALSAAGVRRWVFLSEHAPAGSEFRDQHLHRVLPLAWEAACKVVSAYEAEVVLVPAYEGGHPDHDSCSFLGALLHRHRGLPVWEMPLYHRSPNGELVCGQFHAATQGQLRLLLSPREQRMRDHMVTSYASQTGLTQFITRAVEQFRPQPAYDYTHPPHRGTLNYEAWQWPISPQNVCEAFQSCMRTLQDVQAEDGVPSADPTYQTRMAAAGQ